MRTLLKKRIPFSNHKMSRLGLKRSKKSLNSVDFQKPISFICNCCCFQIGDLYSEKSTREWARNKKSYEKLLWLIRIKTVASCSLYLKKPLYSTNHLVMCKLFEPRKCFGLEYPRFDAFLVIVIARKFGKLCLMAHLFIRCIE